MKKNHPNDPRQTIRREIRALRKILSNEQRAESSAKIVQRFAQLTAFQAATRIAGYLAFDGEADPLELMRIAVNQGQSVYVPIMVNKSKPLLFAPWLPGMPMKTNAFGIAEPDLPRSEWIPANQLDFVIQPLVAFDDRGHRLGVGAGYYDRSFAFLNQVSDATSRPTRLVGFAFELQRVESIARQPWDVVLDGVVTEWNVYGQSGE